MAIIKHADGNLISELGTGAGHMRWAQALAGEHHAVTEAFNPPNFLLFLLSVNRQDRKIHADITAVSACTRDPCM